ncbi:hypothetical protein [Streptomyces sp. NPDC058254]|uniref:hypothetical protein n=1 Tax=Streptomyces sp. NPDC058254 TaxID=3346406 RepID=UPI0036E3D5D3
MTEPTTADRIRALTLREAADHLRDAHFRDGMSVQEIGTALRNTADDADPMVGSLARDGYGLDEIAAMLAEPAAVPSVPADAELRYRIAKALLPHNEWEGEGLNVEAAADSVLAILPTPTDQAAEVWTVWPEDEPILGHYTDEVTAKLAAIEFQQDAEGPGHDFVYAWNEYGGHLQLLANGDDTGFRVKRDKVHGKTAPASADRAAVLRGAADALEAWEPEPSERWTEAERNRYEDGVDAAADHLRRMANEAQQAGEGR